MMAAGVFLCYLLAYYLTYPVRKLQRAVERFGRGDLSARAKTRRRDELGDLGRTFDRMADRIQTLVDAERRLLLDISHELRSPLARLRVAVELARSGQTASSTSTASIKKPSGSIRWSADCCRSRAPKATPMRCGSSRYGWIACWRNWWPTRRSKRRRAGARCGWLPRSRRRSRAMPNCCGGPSRT